MSTLSLLLQVAFRNLFQSRINSIIGLIIFFGTLLVVVGGALLDSMDSAMSRSIIGSVAGHLQVYSAHSKDELALYGQMSGEADLAAIDSYVRIKQVLQQHPNVKTVVPMGTSGALITSGNTIDLTLAKLRELYRQRQEQGETPALREQLESLKAHVRQMVGLLQVDRRNLRALSREEAIDPEETSALEAALEDGFWARFEQDPFDALEFLENRIAPQAADGDLLYIRYVGTDLDTFQRTFERMEVVDGQPVPRGRRGLLLSKLFYEDSLKLKTARRLDRIKEARDLNGKTIAGDPQLQRWVKENTTQTREILFQLDPLKTRTATERLQHILGSREQDLGRLLSVFFEMDDASFDARYAQFYAELAPLLELYRIRMGDTLTISAFTRTGYVQNVNVTIYGTYQFRGLEKSEVAGGLSLMDLVSFRELYGHLTADKRAEIAEMKKRSGARTVERSHAEEDLFGGERDTLVAEATPGLIDESQELSSDTRALRNADLAQRVYSQEEIDQGVVLNAALVLEDPEQLEQTRQELERMSKEAGLDLRVVSWQQASGLVGKFVAVAKLVLYAAVLIIFIVALVIINNAMMMATLRRAREVGTMRAIGAQRSFVLEMVLVETLVLGLLFGVGGALVGTGLMELLGRVGIPAGSEALSFFFSGPRLYPSLTTGNLVAAFVIVLVVSAISTLYPAFLATRVSPLQAMQTDD